MTSLSSAGADGAGGGSSAATAAEDVPADVSFEDDVTGVGSSTATAVDFECQQLQRFRRISFWLHGVGDCEAR